MQCVARRGVKADPALAQDLATEKAAADALQLGDPSLNMERRLDVRDLLPQDTDIAQIQDPIRFQRDTVDQTLT